MTIADAAEQVLAKNGKPMHVKAILDEILRGNLITIAAVDKQSLLYLELLGRSLGGPSDRTASSRPFYRADPATFGLVSWLSPTERTRHELKEAERRALPALGEPEDVPRRG